MDKYTKQIQSIFCTSDAQGLALRLWRKRSKQRPRSVASGAQIFLNLYIK